MANPSSDKPSESKDREVEKLRIERAFQFAILGFALTVLLVIALLVAGMRTSADVAAVVGLFTSVLGTIVGAFFGLQIGSAGTAKAEERAETSEKKTNALMAAADPKVLDEAKSRYPDLFK